LHGNCRRGFAISAETPDNAADVAASKAFWSRHRDCLSLRRKAAAMSINTMPKNSVSTPVIAGSQPPQAAVETSQVCPACGRPEEQHTTRLRIDSARGDSSWAKCNSCGAYYLTGEYDTAAEAGHTVEMPWGQMQAGVRLNDFKKRMYDAALAGIRKHAPEARKILDVGCSFGGFLMEARGQGYEGSGVDIVPEAVDYVQQQGFAAERCGSLEHCQLISEKNPVDVLAVLDAHIYWPNQPAELAAAWRLVKPGGLLVMRVITKSHFVSIGRVIKPIAPKFGNQLIRRSIGDHRFCMPLKTLLHTIEVCGFRIEEVVPRDAQHSDRSSVAVRTLFKVGDLSWKMLRFHLAPGAMIYARKPHA
jgi:SAM-dependent methyltransferase